MLCAFCRKPVLPSEPSERLAGRGPTEMRAHAACVPTPQKQLTERDFREHVSFEDDAAPATKKLQERELREKKSGAVERGDDLDV